MERTPTNAVLASTKAQPLMVWSWVRSRTSAVTAETARSENRTQPAARTRYARAGPSGRSRDARTLVRTLRRLDRQAEGDSRPWSWRPSAPTPPRAHSGTRGLTRVLLPGFPPRKRASGAPRRRFGRMALTDDAYRGTLILIGAPRSASRR